MPLNPKEITREFLKISLVKNIAEGRKGMALDMSQIERIRDLQALGYSPSEIRRETGYSYPTIRKYLAIDDFLNLP